ncbi:MAG: hypothetical protein JNM57_05130 [Cyclobacteriaceae bacterium]|nr:hypothetical protein [Cyclobacteriaceae bacterium]
MKFKQSITFFICAVVAFGLVSCGSSNDNKNKDSKEFEEAQKSLQHQIEEVVYNIPSPSEIPYLLQATGAEFNESLLNPRSKADQYVTRTDKAALNLGVYAADIGYLSSYDKTQEAIDYLGSCKTLADNLGVIGSFDMEVLKKFEQNISNKDSLSRLLDNTINKTESFLKDDKRNKLSALVVTGSFIEGLYISTGLIKTYPKNLLADDQRNLVLTPLMRIVLEQKKSVSELLKMLTTVEQTDPIVAIVTDLKVLETTYQALNIEEQIRNNKANLVLSDKNLVEITKIIEKLRNGITE